MVLLAVGLVALPGLASASSACPRCAGHGDKVGGDYIVKAGDTLSGIAATHRTVGGAATLYARNHDVLTSADRIYVGQRLLVGAPAPKLSSTLTLSLYLNGQRIDRLSFPGNGGTAISIVPAGPNRVNMTAFPIQPGPGVPVQNQSTLTLRLVLSSGGVTVRSTTIYPHMALTLRLPSSSFR